MPKRTHKDNRMCICETAAQKRLVSTNFTLNSNSAEQKNMVAFAKPMVGKHRKRVSCTSDRHSCTVSQNNISSPHPVDIRCWNPFILLELLPEFKTLNNSKYAHKGKEIKHHSTQKTRFFTAGKQDATKFSKHGSRNVVIDKGNVCISERCEIQPTSRHPSSVLISGQKHANSQEDILLDGDCLAKDFASRDESKKRKENSLQELPSCCAEIFSRLCNHKFSQRPWMKYQGTLGQIRSQCHTTFLGKSRHCRNETATFQELVARQDKHQGGHFGSLQLEGKPQKGISAQRAALIACRHQMRAQSFTTRSQPAPVPEKRKGKPCKYCEQVISAEQQRVHNQRRHPFNCNFCRWQFVSKEELLCHKKECEDLRYATCEMCNCLYFKSQKARHCHSQKHRVILQAMRKGAGLSQSTGTFNQYLMKALCPQGHQCQVCNSFLMPNLSVQETNPASSCFETEDRLVSATSETEQFSPAAQQQLVESDPFLFLNDPILSQDCQEQVGVDSDTINYGMSTIVPKHDEGGLSLLGLLEDGRLSLPPLLQESSISACSSPAVVNNIHTISMFTSSSDEADDLALSLFAAPRDAELCIDDSLDMLVETEHTQTSPNSPSRLSHHTTQFPNDNTSSGSVTCMDILSLTTSELSSVDASVSRYDNIGSIFDHRGDFLWTMPCSSKDGCKDMLSDSMNLTSPDSTDSGFDQLSLESSIDLLI